MTRGHTHTTPSTRSEAARLARQLAAATGPSESLRAITDLRKHLDVLEAEHVDGALALGYSWRLIADALGVSRQAAHRKHAGRAARKAQQPEQPPSLAGNRLVILAPVRVAVALARQEAESTAGPLVGTEHLLLGLLHERKGVAAQALGELGASLEKLRHCVRMSLDRAHGDPETEDHEPPAWTAAPATRLPFSRRGRQALEQALREAVRLGDETMGVEHLLLALLRDERSRAVDCLARLRITPPMVEQELGRLRDGAPPDAQRWRSMSSTR